MEQEQSQHSSGPGSRQEAASTQPASQPVASCSNGTSSDASFRSSSGTDSAGSSRNTPRLHDHQYPHAARPLTNPSAAPERLSSQQQQPAGLAELSALEASLGPDGSILSSTPAKDLTDVSHRLKKLERAVKAHLLAGQRGLSSGGASILASASGGQQHSVGSVDATASFGSPVFAPSSADGAGSAAASAGPRLSERVQLRETLSGIKTDIADLAVRQVEAQMLQQRVLRLEAVIAGMGGLGPWTGVAGPACMSVAGGFNSFAGSLASGAPGGAAAARPEPRLTRTPSDVAVLADRLYDMEGLMRELAEAQVANTAVLQQIGGRLPSPAPPSPDSHIGSSYGVPAGAFMGGYAAAGNYRGSPDRCQPQRPPSCPLTGGVLNSPFGTSPPAAQLRRRAPSPDTYCSRGSSYASVHAQRGTSVLSGSDAYTRSQASPSAGPLSAMAAAAPVASGYPVMPEMRASGMQAQQGNNPGLQQEQWLHWQQPPHQQHASQHLQPHSPAQPQQQQWQVEVVLAGHDADIATVKGAVQYLEQDSHAAAAMADGMAAQLGNLAHRVSELEQTAAAAAAGAGSAKQRADSADAALSDPSIPATSLHSTGTARQAAVPEGAAVASAFGILDQADLVSAIEGLATDAVHGIARLDALEASAGQQGTKLQSLKSTTDLLTAQLQQVSSSVEALSCKVLLVQAPANALGASLAAGIPACEATATATTEPGYSHLQQQVMEQLLSSSALQLMVNARVEQLLQQRIEAAVSAQLAEAAGHAAEAAAAAATTLAAGAAESRAQQKRQWVAPTAKEFPQRSFTEDAGQPTAATCASPHVPRKLQAAFDALAERLAGLQAQASAGQAEVIQEALQHLHSRLLQVEELVTAQYRQQEKPATTSQLITTAVDKGKATVDSDEVACEAPPAQPGQQQQQQQQLQALLDSEDSEGSASVIIKADSPEQLSTDEPLASGEQSYSSESGQPAETVDATSSAVTSGTECEAAPPACAVQQLSLQGRIVHEIGSDGGEDGSCSPAPANPTATEPAATIEAATALVAAASDAAVTRSTSGEACAVAVLVSGAAAASRCASTDLLERQVALLQQEMASHQLMAVQAAVEDMGRQMAAVQQALTQQAAMIEHQRAAAAASSALLAPLEPRVSDLAGQLAALSHATAQQPARLEELQHEIEQLSRQLAQVNEGAADESEVEELKCLLNHLVEQQQQMQAQVAQQATQTAAAAAAAAAVADAMVATAAGQPTADDNSSAETAEAHITPATAAELVAALDASVQQQLASTQEALVKLQEQLEGRVADAAAQAAAAAAAAAGHSADAEELSGRASELVDKLAALETAVADSKASTQALLEQRVGDLQAAAAEQGVKMQGQAETAAQVLAEVSQAKAAQAEEAQQLRQQLEALSGALAASASAQSQLQATLSGQVEASAQQLRQELDAALSSVHQQLLAAEQQLAEHADALGGCAKSSVLAGVVATLQGLPGTVEALQGRLDELAQMQRAADGQLNAAQEQNFVLHEQIGALQQHVQSLAGSMDGRQGEVAEQMQQLLEPVHAELQQLQQRKAALAEAQEQQAVVVQRLGAAVGDVRDDVMTELSHSREELAQSIDELQNVVSERCLKTDQLGAIFAARDNMYGAWMKMQAVFESNKSQSGATTSRASNAGFLFKMRPSLTLSPLVSALSTSTAADAAGTSAFAAASMANAINPFEEKASSSRQSDGVRAAAGSAGHDPAAPAGSAVPAASSEAALAATADAQDELVAPAAAAAEVNAADLAAVLDSQIQLREMVAQLSEQLAALQQQQQPLAASTPLPQPEASNKPEDMPPARSASASSTFLLTLQHELAGVAVRVAEINSKLDEQSSQVQAAAATATAAMAAAAAAGALPVSSTTSRRTSRSTSNAAAVTAQPVEGSVAAETLADLQRCLAAMQEQVRELQQQQQLLTTADSSNPVPEGEQKQDDASGPKADAPYVGVLHAPLSVVVQLQQELAALREGQVSKEQFAAVVRMMRDLKEPEAHTAAQSLQQQLASLQAQMAAAEAAAADGRQQAAVAVEVALQQQDERLAAAEFSIESLLQRTEATATASVEAMDALLAEQQLQQHCSTYAGQQQQEFADDLAALQMTMQQQTAAVEGVCATTSEAQQQASELSSQLDSMRVDQAKLSACVDDLAAKVASAANAAASAVSMPRRIGSEDAAGGSGFGEMVGGLANLKGCLDAQCQAVAAVQQRLDAQEEAVAELVAAVVTRAEAVALTGIEGAAAAAGGPDGGRTASKLAGSTSRSASSKGSFAMKADIAEALELRSALEKLTLKVTDMEQKMQHHEQTQHQQEAAGPALLSLPSSRRSVSGAGCIIDAEAAPATAGSTAAIVSSLSASRRVSRVSSIAAADAIELTAAAADEAAVAVAGPMSVVHQILTELKKRVEALEAPAATTAAAAPSAAGPSAVTLMHSNALVMPSAPAAAGASVPSTPSSRAGTGSRRGAAWLAASGEAASLAELQELVERLQQDVSRIAMDSSSHTAELNSLRGDVGAAAAAAAAAAAVSGAAVTRPTSCELPAGGAGLAVSDVAGLLAEAAAATTAAAAASKAAAEAQEGLQALSQELLQLQVQLGSQANQLVVAGLDGDAAAAHDTAVTMLQEEVAAIKAQVQQACSSSSSCDGRQLQLAAQLQALEQQVQQVASIAAAAAAVPVAVSRVDAVEDLRVEIAQIKEQMLAAEAGAAQAVAALQAEVQALQDQLAWASSSAAAAASAAATDAVEEVREQLEDLHSQVVHVVALSRSTTGCAAHVLTSDAAAGKDTPAGLTRIAAAAAAQPLVCRSGLSFNDLAVAPRPSARALLQQLFTSVTSETVPAADPAGCDAAAGDSSENNSWFNPMFEEGPLAAAGQQQEQPLAGAAGRGLGSLMSDAGDAAVGAAGVSGQQLLGAQLALLSPAHQVEFLGKLARVVSSHAARLLATYREDAALAGQLQQVQERLSSFASTTASAATASGRAGRASDASSARLSMSSSISRRSLGAVPAGMESVGSKSSGYAAGEVLLGILNQVAALRAIGSATHPAISQALQQHAAQIAAIQDAQQQLQQTLASVSAGGSSSNSLAQDGKGEEHAAAPMPVLAAAIAELSNSSSAAAGAAAVGGEQFEGEYGQRLTALEARLSSGLRVLATLRDRLSPLQEVADASQCMMRELQVAQGLVLQRLEALEGLAAAGVGQAGSEREGQEGSPSGGALAVAGSLRKLQDDVCALSRRLSAAEGSLASTSECLSVSRRVAARMADADARNAQLAGKVSSVASSLPLVVGRMGELEGRLARSLAAARRGLELLADQLVALGALNGRASPNRNPLAALGPNHAAMTALEGKVEAVRTAMSASVGLMVADLGTEAAAGSATGAQGQAGLAAAVAETQHAASAAVGAAMASHQEALMGLEGKVLELRTELRSALAAAGRQVQQPEGIL